MNDTAGEKPQDEPVATAPRTRRRRPWIVWGLGLLGVGIVVLGIRAGSPQYPIYDSNTTPKPVSTPASDALMAMPTVKTIRPKRESSVPITVDQIAIVEPYYRADLRARASGIVRRVNHDIGEKVKKGEILIEIDVPESEQDVARAEAMILQREQELKVSKAKLKDAKAAKDVSAATIKQRDADVLAASATRDLKRRRFARFQDLAAKGSVVGSVVEEEERDYLASEASVTSAKANVERAIADYAESESKVEAAAADIELKMAQIIVSRKDLDRARAIADYGKVTAPFDGVVIRRTVDPGSFVQNATTSTSEALISIAKVDIVTVSAKFPDTAAPYITVGTPATVHVDDLAGVTINAKVTRLAPSVQNADRTMRVEVDLFNGDETEYHQLQDAIARGGPDRPTKGADETLPLRAFPPDAPKSRRLLPGMIGSIRLTIGGFGESYVVPSSAVYSRGGSDYMLLVEKGVTKKVPVRIQMNDGKATRVAIVRDQKTPDGQNRETLVDLKGDEEIVIARQLEFAEGTKVRTGLSEW